MGSGLFGRAIIVGVGALFAVGGLAIIVGGGPPASGGLSLVVIGLVFILAGVLERMRYRSESADRSGSSST